MSVNMNKIKVFCLLCFLVFGIGVFFTSNLVVPPVQSFSSGPPASHTGAPPSEPTCAQCHSANPGPGVFTITAPASYLPGQTYPIQVHHSTTDMTRSHWGFQLTALDGLNNSAGTFTPTTSFTQTIAANSRFYIGHTLAGTFSGATGGVTWSFNWNAPATNVGPITFYAAGDEAGSGGITDDQVYTTSTISQSGATPTSTSTPTPTGTPSISGTVSYGNAAAPPKFISNVTVTGTGSPNVSTTTAAPGGTAGQYTLSGFGSASYTVSLSKTTGQNSITSNDAARIAQHVSGALLLTSNNQKVAADVSNNGIVSSFDAAQIATFVATGSSPGIAGQWRFFVSPGPTFPVGTSATSRIYPSVTGNTTGEDYIGLLIGEVTGNWAPGPLRPAYGPERSSTVELPDLVTSAEKELDIPVSVKGSANKGIISYEFDLRYDPSVIQPLSEPVNVAKTVSRGLLTVVNASEPGLLRVVMYGPVPIDEDGVLLNLRFTSVGTPGSDSPLILERIMFNEGEPSVIALNGAVKIAWN